MAKKKAQQTEQTEGTEIALFPKLNLPAVTQITEEMNATFKTMFTRIEDDIRGLPTDMSDPKNRAAVASYAYKVSRTKTGLDDAAASVATDAKAIVDSVNAERRTLKETLDSLRDKARAPLDAWEAAETERKHFVQTAIDYLEGVHVYSQLEAITSEVIRADWLAVAGQEFPAGKYGEDAGMLAELKTLALDRLDRRYKEEVKREQEAAELEQLRREKAEREAAEAARIAEEERKASEAAEAARQEEERARIAQEAEEKAKREAAEAIENERREREAAEQRAKEAEEREAKRIEDEKRREIEAEEERKEQARLSEEFAKERERKAAELERQKIAAETLAREKADQERAADIAHRRKLNAEAVAALVKAAGLDEKQAQAVVIAIYKEQVPHVAISY